MIIQFIALFFATYLALRETKSTSNIAHVLSRVSDLIDHNNKKEKETKNMIKLNMCFILGAILNTQI